MHFTRTAGFTVVEVFLVITLLAIVASLMVVPVHRLAAAVEVRPLGEVVLSTVRNAHIEARRRNETIILYYLGESNVLQLCSVDGLIIEETPLLPDSASEAREPLLKFYRMLPGDPELETVAYEPEEETVSSLVFSPAGFSTPFAVDLLDQSSPVRLVMDPFSSEPLQREAEGIGL